MTMATVLALGALLGAPPERPDPKARYVFYLHGKIIEDQGRKPTHPRWGVYDYDAVVDALREPGHVVISEVRAAHTAVGRYARKVAGQVQQLLDAGVPPGHVTVVGFSKGGAIALSVSERVMAPIRYVLLASCGKAGEGPALHGHVLSIVEKSDTMMGSCAPRFARSPALVEPRELQIQIGGEHGAFYRPHPAWVEPVLRWIAESPPPAS